ncbi:MAG: hypothetical protein HY711_10265 [Candidatus Melainabacteria bacterium]|nr:hypothetical protein [Candidatus Melainabacteria bacterium]
MVRIELRTVWLGLMLAMLVVTSPTWLKSEAQVKASYDAPWVYPALNPAVRAQMYLLH